MLPNGRAHPLDRLNGAGVRSRLCVRRARLESGPRLSGSGRSASLSLGVLAGQLVIVTEPVSELLPRKRPA